jgi:hypothetical protein
MTALFALPISDQFPQRNDSNVFTAKYIGTWMGKKRLATKVCCMLIWP